MSDDRTEYRVEYQIQRRLPGEDDFTEIGFGSGAGLDVDGAIYEVGSYVSHGQWETEPGQPDPDDVLRDIQEARND